MKHRLAGIIWEVFLWVILILYFYFTSLFDTSFIEGLEIRNNRIRDYSFILSLIHTGLFTICVYFLTKNTKSLSKWIFSLFIFNIFIIISFVFIDIEYWYIKYYFLGFLFGLIVYIVNCSYKNLFLLFFLLIILSISSLIFIGILEFLVRMDPPYTPSIFCLIECGNSRELFICIFIFIISFISLSLINAFRNKQLLDKNNL